MPKLKRIHTTVDNPETGPVSPDKLISGSPMQITANQFTNSKENFFCGIWSSDSGKWNVSYTEDEFCYLVKGQAIVTDSDGHSETINANEAFVIPAGFEGTWESVGETQKFYAIYEA